MTHATVALSAILGLFVLTVAPMAQGTAQGTGQGTAQGTGQGTAQGTGQGPVQGTTQGTPPSPAAPTQPRQAAPAPAPQAAPPTASRLGGSARIGDRRKRTYASCNRVAQARGLRGGVRRRYLIRCKLGYEKTRGAQTSPGRQP